jgi:hypothetical protein
VPGGAQGFVAGDCCRAVLFPRPSVHRIGMIGVACRSMMAVWQRRVS